jgi:hypothetical protein
MHAHFFTCVPASIAAACARIGSFQRAFSLERTSVRMRFGELLESILLEWRVHDGS